MTELKTFKTSIADVKLFIQILSTEFKDKIIEKMKDRLMSKSTQKVYFDFQSNNTYQFSFQQELVDDVDSDNQISEEIQVPVSKLHCYFNDHFIGNLNFTADDTKGDWDEEDESFIFEFITSQIAKVVFQEWFIPNVSRPGLTFNTIKPYHYYIKSILNGIGYNSRIDWDQSVFNYSIFQEDPYRIVVQQTLYTGKEGLISEQTLLTGIRVLIEAVFLEFFLQNKFGENIYITLNDITKTE